VSALLEWERAASAVSSQASTEEDDISDASEEYVEVSAEGNDFGDEVSVLCVCVCVCVWLLRCVALTLYGSFIVWLQAPLCGSLFDDVARSLRGPPPTLTTTISSIITPCRHLKLTTSTTSITIVIIPLAGVRRSSRRPRSLSC
jgi:hypothetical protein